VSSHLSFVARDSKVSSVSSNLVASKPKLTSPPSFLLFFLFLSGMAPPPAGALPPGYRGPAGQQNVRPRAPGGPPNGVALPSGGPPAIPGATSRVPPRPVAAGPRAPTGLTAASLAASSPAEQKQTLGEALYPLIAAINDPLAGKITGMLLEMDVYELLHLIETPEALLAKTSEAMGESFFLLVSSSLPKSRRFVR